MGGYGRQPLRHEPAPSAAVAMGPSTLLAADGKFKHYLDCYWQHFHPLFPIIHRSSFISTSPPPLLALLMVVIGAQFSLHPESKNHSAFLYEYCVGYFSTVSGSAAISLAEYSFCYQQNPITTRSCLSDMQTVILLEAFSCYRAREAKLENIAVSSRFRALYSSVCFFLDLLGGYTDGWKLLLDEDIFKLDSALPLVNSPSMPPPALDQAKRLWTRRETKRRILMSAFVLDTQNSAFFQRQPCCSIDLDNMNLPYPQSTETWDCNDLVGWRDLVNFHQPLDLRFLEDNFTSLVSVDVFQSSVLSCYQIHRTFFSISNLRNDAMIFYPPELHYAPAYLTHHSLHFSSLTPIESLLLVSSGSWLFGTKITDASVWTSAKLALRVWVSTETAARCVWHAIQVLRLALAGENLHILHEQWCIYLAALVCWAYGFVPRHPSSAVPDPITIDVAKTQAWDYLDAMNVASWEEVARVSLKWHVRGLLKCVETHISGPTGGLLNQAKDVLVRLVEGKSQLMDF